MSVASYGVDVIDANWRILQGGKEKICTRRGWRRVHCNFRRARGDRCTHREHSTEGPRTAALERATHIDVEQELDEADDERFERPSYNGGALRAFVAHRATRNLRRLAGEQRQATEERLAQKAIKRSVKAYERRIRKADERELDPDACERAILLNIENQWRHRRERYTDIHARRHFLKDFIEFLEEQVDNGAGAPTCRLLIEHRIELCELESVLYAA